MLKVMAGSCMETYPGMDTVSLGTEEPVDLRNI